MEEPFVYPNEKEKEFMTNQEFIDYAKNSEEIQNIIKKYKPYSIFLGGSRALEMNTEQSDYDVIALVPERRCAELKKIKLDEVEGKECHMFMYSISYYITTLIDVCSHGDFIFLLIGLLNPTAMLKYVIYEQEGNEFYNTFKNYSVLFEKEIISSAIYRILFNHIDEVRAAAIDNKLPLSTKVYYKILAAYDALYNDNSKELINKIRRNYILRPQEIEVFHNKLQKMIDFYDNFDETQLDSLKQYFELLLLLREDLEVN